MGRLDTGALLECYAELEAKVTGLYSELSPRVIDPSARLIFDHLEESAIHSAISRRIATYLGIKERYYRGKALGGFIKEALELVEEVRERYGGGRLGARELGELAPKLVRVGSSR